MDVLLTWTKRTSKFVQCRQNVVHVEATVSTMSIEGGISTALSSRKGMTSCTQLCYYKRKRGRQTVVRSHSWTPKRCHPFWADSRNVCEMEEHDPLFFWLINMNDMTFKLQSVCSIWPCVIDIFVNNYEYRVMEYRRCLTAQYCLGHRLKPNMCVLAAESLLKDHT